MGYPVAEIIGYGLVAAAVAGGVLYLDGQTPRTIASVVGAILALLATLAIVAPRLRTPIQSDDSAPASRDQTPIDATPPAPRGVPSAGEPEPRTPKPGRRAKHGRRRR